MMDVVETRLLQDHPWVTRRPITTDEYHRMGEAGVFAHGARIELIEGQIVAMAPIGSGHSGLVNTLTRRLVGSVAELGVVSVQNPVRLDRFNEPEPDFAVLKPRADDYQGATPTAADVLLLIEIADSSLGYDRAVKKPLYARHGIPEFWIVDVQARQVEVCRAPGPDGYANVAPAPKDGVLRPVMLPTVEIEFSTLFRSATSVGQG